jgi:hypothetical protein
MIFFSTSWGSVAFSIGREHVGCVSDRIFILVAYTHICFMRESTVILCSTHWI